MLKRCYDIKKYNLAVLLRLAAYNRFFENGNVYRLYFVYTPYHIVVMHIFIVYDLMRLF